MHDDAALIQSAAGGAIDIAIVLGSGLSDVLRGHFDTTSIAYERLRSMPVAPLSGHGAEALLGTWNGKRVAAFAGRVHLYQGFSSHDVTAAVRLAAAAGAHTIVLTNAAGALDSSYEPGDLMLIADQINLTGHNPLIGMALADPFVDMVDAYAPRLRELARSATSTVTLREGTYAGLLGPSYETPAEARHLRSIGADAVGMSTVLETIVARSLRMQVFGVSLITNMVAVAGTAHADVAAMGRQRAMQLAELLDAVIAGA